MLKKPLGSSGVSTSVIGMGTAAMDTADYYNNTDTKEAIRAIHAALDQGIRLIECEQDLFLNPLPCLDFIRYGAKHDLLGARIYIRTK